MHADTHIDIDIDTLKRILTTDLHADTLKQISISHLIDWDERRATQNTAKAINNKLRNYLKIISRKRKHKNKFRTSEWRDAAHFSCWSHKQLLYCIHVSMSRASCVHTVVCCGAKTIGQRQVCQFHFKLIWTWRFYFKQQLIHSSNWKSNQFYLI